MVWPFGASHAGVVLAKHYFTLLFLLGGLFLELTAHPQGRLAHLRHLPRFLRAHPPLFLALFLALWMGLATAFSPEPQVALTGSVVDYSDGLVWGLMMVGVFALGYLRSLFDLGLGQRVALGVLGGASVLALEAWARLQAFLKGRVSFHRLPLRTWEEKAMGFAALLEAFRLGWVRLSQEENFGPLWVEAGQGLGDVGGWPNAHPPPGWLAHKPKRG